MSFTSFLRFAVVASACLGSIISYAEPAPAPMRFRVTADPTTLDWNLAHTNYEAVIVRNIMEGLAGVDADLKAQPALAERWDVSPDGKTYTFHLRQGVKWSDGQPLKASDFVESWLRLIDPATGSTYSSYLADIENAERFRSGEIKNRDAVGVKALGDSKLEVKLRRAVPHFPHMLSFWVTFPVRMDLIKKYGKEWAKPGKIVTVGPYLLESWVAGKVIRLKRNPGYNPERIGPTPTIETIEAIIEPSDARARALFDEGKIDLLLDATTSDIVREGNRARMERFPLLATAYLGFNTLSGPLKDVQIRKAIALAIDRAEIPAAMQGGQIPAKGWIPPELEGHGNGNALSGTLYDARGALMKAGYAEGSRFPKLTIWIGRMDGADALGKFLVQSLRRKLGIELQYKLLDPPEYFRMRRAGKMDLFVGQWSADFPSPESFFDVFKSKTILNNTGWKNADYDRLVMEAQVSKDPEKRRALFAEAEKLLLQKDAVILPLFYKRMTVLVNNRIRGVKTTPINHLILKTARIR